MIRGLEIRPVQSEDSLPLSLWLSDPETTPFFPVADPSEIQDIACRWTEMAVDQSCGLTALYQGTPVGFAICFLQTYERLKHESVHILLVDRAYRGMGIGGGLLQALEEKACRSGVELFHVEVYNDASIERFYRKRGFVEFGRQERWTKDDGLYRARVLMEKLLTQVETVD